MLRFLYLPSPFPGNTPGLLPAVPAPQSRYKNPYRALSFQSGQYPHWQLSAATVQFTPYCRLTGNNTQSAFSFSSCLHSYLLTDRQIHPSGNRHKRQTILPDSQSRAADLPVLTVLPVHRRLPLHPHSPGTAHKTDRGCRNSKM